MLHAWKEDSMLVKRIAAYIFNREILVGNCNFFPIPPLAFKAPVEGVTIGIQGKSLVLRKL